jgi:DNA helicase IV
MATRPQSYLKFKNDLIEILKSDFYISDYSFNDIKKRYSHLSLSLTSLANELVSPKQAFRKALIIIQIRRLLKSRQSHNRQTIKNQVNRPNQYEIDRKHLDPQQIEAVVACEDATLIIAAAGSGKTLSLLAKIHYITKTLKMHPSKTLILSFTKSSSNDLKERIDALGMPSNNVRTFHSLGKWILDKSTPTVTKLVEEPAVTDFFSHALERLCSNDAIYARKYNHYILNLHTVPVALSSNLPPSSLVKSNRDYLRKTLKASIDGAQQPIRDKKDQLIANFLYINQVSYSYRKRRPFPDLDYVPSFFIDGASPPVYIEHFSLDQKGRPLACISDPKDYIKELSRKRSLHKQNNTILIELYDFLWQKEDPLASLENKLRSQGVPLNRMNEQSITALIKKAYPEDVSSFFSLCLTFLHLLKNSALSSPALKEKISALGSVYQVNRTQQFYELFQPLYDLYTSHLRQNNLQDFADMILLATEKIKQLPPRAFEFDYILVDEAQDLSYGKFALVKALLDKTPGSRLFCVGDDWQSIYRFTGSDLTLLQDFEDYFDRPTYKSLIEKTHRFGQPAVGLSTSFIQTNPHQITKDVRSRPDLHTKITIHLNSDRDGDAATVHRILVSLSRKYSLEGLRKKTIHILSRYNRDISRLYNHPNFTILDQDTTSIVSLQWRLSSSSPPIDLAFSSMHKSKGLTKDVVLIINCNEGLMGMPANQPDDPVLAILLARPDGFPFSEERRLFYVALTRAKETTHVIANRQNPSRFLFEIDSEFLEADSSPCPWCGTGQLVERRSAYGFFLGCTNYKYGCDYTEDLGPGVS